MKIDHYLERLILIARQLNHLVEILDENLELEIEKNLKIVCFEQIIDAIQNIKLLSDDLTQIKSLILIDQDFINFCLLIAYGWDMAEYLLSLTKTSKKIRSRAGVWKDLAIKLKPLLKNDIYN